MTGVVLPSADVSGPLQGFDIYQQLLKERIIFLGTPVDDKIANAICAQMLFLAGQDPNRTSGCTSTRPVVR
jgi:ATP-dependent Clp protease, protease subunit